jgi:hypothetical protein
MVTDSRIADPANRKVAAAASTGGDSSSAVQRANDQRTPAVPAATTMPGATGNVRELPNGAIVSGNGYFYWSGWKWKALVPDPPAKAPGNYSRERLSELPKLVRGKSIPAMRNAGTELSRLVSEQGSLKAAEEHLSMTARSALEAEGSTPPEDAIRSPDGTQWWDGEAWLAIAIPATALRSPDGSSWWDGAKWQAVARRSARPTETPAETGSTTPKLGRNQVKVKSYKSDGAFQRDADKMMRDGWRIEGQVAQGGHVSLGKTLIKSNLTLGLGLLTGFSRTKDKITVTWIR